MRRETQTLVLITLILSCFSEFNVIELNHDLGHDTPYHVTFGTEPFSYEIIEASNDRGYWLASGKYRAFEFMGTIVNAPYSFNEKGITIDQIPIEQLFGDVAVIDIRHKVGNNGNYEMSVADIKEWLSINGMFSNNSFVLINTGWEKGRYPNQLAYFGDDKPPSNLTFPGMSLDAMKEFLRLEKEHGINIVSFGIDTPRLDFGQAKIPHVTILHSSLNKYGIKNLKDLDKLPAKGAKLMVAPIKIRNGGTAQARVFARLPY